MGKGSSPRPFSVSQREFSENHDAIFGKKDTVCPVCGRSDCPKAKFKNLACAHKHNNDRKD